MDKTLKVNTPTPNVDLQGFIHYCMQSLSSGGPDGDLWLKAKKKSYEGHF